MKLLLINLILAGSLFGNDFDQGYIDGYKRKYMRENNTNVEPIEPLVPIQSIKGFGDPDSDYEHGYLEGMDE